MSDRAGAGHGGDEAGGVPALPALPRRPLVYTVLADVLDLLTRLLRWRWDVTGAEQVPARGGAVITWNHLGHLDFLAVACEIWLLHRRPVRFLTLEEHFERRLLGPLLRSVGAIPVRRGSARGGDAYALAIEAARAGHLVMIAPEGRLSTSMELLPFRSGAVRIAAAADVPLLPAATFGTQRLSAHGHRFHPAAMWRLPVAVAFAPPVVDHEGTTVDEATAALEATTASLYDEVLARYAGGLPAGAWWVPARLGGGAPSTEAGR